MKQAAHIANVQPAQASPGQACTSVFVVDRNNVPLMPCTPRRARLLLKSTRADVYKMRPFTIRMLDREQDDCTLQAVELKVDPGSKHTGIAMMVECERSGWTCVNAWEIQHRGQQIKNNLSDRAALRRGRRGRKTRYRQPRFLNRTRAPGWLPPSLMSRVDNVVNFVKKISKLCPITGVPVEQVRFDLQKMETPEISGIEYQQGELAGYEVREYLLLKWNHQCAYCNARDIPLQIEHIVPKSKGGTNRISNLCIACNTCNQKKGNLSIDVFLANKPKLLKQIKSQAKAPLKDAAAVNSTRKALVDALGRIHSSVSTGSGGQTKYNRIRQGLRKSHWIDAACVGSTGRKVDLSRIRHITLIQAKGRGSRQMCKPDARGFPRTSAKSVKRLHGFQTGDHVQLDQLSGKYKGVHEGIVSIRATGIFDIKTATGKITSSYKNFISIARFDGYTYQKRAV